MTRYTIKFRYADQYSNWQWRTQYCTLYAKSEYEAQKKCRELYGLGIDCEYEILSVDKA